jgi:hypothetical protein
MKNNKPVNIKHNINYIKIFKYSIELKHKSITEMHGEKNWDS